MIIIHVAMQLKPNTILQSGRYRIIDTLGRGGFGITYLAEQVMARRKVCIKEYFPEDYYRRDSDTGALSLSSEGFAETMNRYKAKFIKEAQTIAALDHPNIIHIHDIFEENNTAYYVMEYIEGESLSDVVKRNGVLGESEAIGYIRQVALALEYIHSRQIMHLDVKPGNVMIRQMDCSAILIDFGLSKHYDAVSGEATSTTPVGVSHGFAPIEQYKRGGVSRFSPETDIYSLGATLYYLVTGKIPPEAATLVTEPLDIPEGVSSAVRDAITKAMSIAPAQRPHNIGEFTAMLESIVSENEMDEVIEIEEVCEVEAGDERTVLSSTIAATEVMPPCNEIWYTSLDGNLVHPNSVKAFGDASFKDSNGKTKFFSKLFNLPSWSNTIKGGKGVIRFNSDITEIGWDAFKNCENLSSIVIPTSVTKFGCGAFQNCENLSSIVIPTSVTRIDGSVFSGCRNLKSITIPNGVRVVDCNAFYKCSNLIDISIPESLSSIGDGAFWGCDNLKSIISRNGLPSVSRGMLKFCSRLTSVAISDKVSIIHTDAFLECSSLRSITIPNSVTKIESRAFHKCYSLTSVIIPNSVTEIDHGAFSECKSLTSIAIPNTITTIKSCVFTGCSSLNNIKLYEGLSVIEAWAFAGCSNLNSITIPSSVTFIGDGVFSLCNNLKSIYCKAIAPPKLLPKNYVLGTEAPDLCINGGCTIYVHRGFVEAYKNTEGWSKYKDQIVGYDFD